jgi:NADPH-dependent 2,4-dienoyl-CoA reductase/sulfur reductase-like enzyme
MGKCAINPDSGFGFYPELYPMPKAGKRVLVIGGGVGGMQAAITAVQRGHTVTLIEKQALLGGTINFTDLDEDKIDLRNFKNLLIREVKESGAKILLNTGLSKDIIDSEKPDVILAAVGAYPIVPKIPGIETAIGALDVYTHLEKIGKNVVMLGGGLVGAEVGLFLANENRHVTVVEMQAMMAYETLGYYRNALLTEMDKRNIEQRLNTKCLAIEKNGVRVAELDKDGKESFIPADTCVFSFGMKPNEKSLDEIRAIAGSIPVIALGDCQQVGKLGDAVRAGHIAALQIA